MVAVLKKCKKQISLLSVRKAVYNSFKAKSQRAIRFHSCKSIFIIFAPFYVNSSCQNGFKNYNLHDLIHIFLDNGVMTTPKREILSFVFTVLCFKRSLLIFQFCLWIRRRSHKKLAAALEFSSFCVLPEPSQHKGTDLGK